MVRDTQLNAYYEVEPKLPSKRKAVYYQIKGTVGGMTLWEIARAMKWTINNVSGRVTELAKAGLVKDSGWRRCNPASGKKGIVWLASNVIMAAVIAGSFGACSMLQTKKPGTKSLGCVDSKEVGEYEGKKHVLYNCYMEDGSLRWIMGKDVVVPVTGTAKVKAAAKK